MTLIKSGQVHNPIVVPIAFPFFTGPAGVRDAGAGTWQFAIFARRSAMPQAGKVNGRPAQAISAVRSDVTDGMIVVTFRYTDD